MQSFFPARRTKELLSLSMILAASWAGQGALAADQQVQTQQISAKPKVLEFYASWCVPCTQQKATMDRAAAEYGSEVEFVRIDVDAPESREIVKQYEVCPIPTVIFLDANQQISSYAIGNNGERVINKGINKILPASHVSTSNTPASTDSSKVAS